MKKRRAPDPILVLFSIVGAILITFLALPLIATVLSQEPSNIAAALSDPEVQSAIYTSFGAALIATMLSIGFGIPLAYVMARSKFRGKSILQGVTLVL